MVQRVLLAGAVAGLVAGLALTALQAVAVTPLLRAAETYEGGADRAAAVEHAHGARRHVHARGHRTHAHDGHALVLADGEPVSAAGEAAARPAPTGGAGAGRSSGPGGGASAHHHAAAGSPEDGIGRTAWTAVSNVAAAVGFALLLAAVFAWRGGATWLQGLLWGAAGFVVFFANPAIGLRPGLPGAFAADLLDRQLWWLLTVGCSAAGVGLLLLAPRKAVKLGGAALLLAPHLVGAPPPAGAGGLAPQGLADRFVIVTTAVNGVFWLVLGLASALACRRLTLPPGSGRAVPAAVPDRSPRATREGVSDPP